MRIMRWLEMKQKQLISKIFGRLIATSLLILAVASMGAAAIDITVDVPSTPMQPNQIVTIPVTIHQPGDIIAFAAEVANDVSGATITINSMEPLSSGMYVINSDAEQKNQYVSWISSSGISTDSATMFFIDVFVKDTSLTSVPIKLNIPELGSNANDMLPVGSYSVGQAVLKVGVNGQKAGNVPAATPATTATTATTAATETPTATGTNVSPTETVVQTESTATPTTTTTTASTLPQPTGQPTPTKTSGFSMILVIVAIAAMAFVTTKSRKN